MGRSSPAGGILPIKMANHVIVDGARVAPIPRGAPSTVTCSKSASASWCNAGAPGTMQIGLIVTARSGTTQWRRVMRLPAFPAASCGDRGGLQRGPEGSLEVCRVVPSSAVVSVAGRGAMIDHAAVCPTCGADSALKDERTGEALGTPGAGVAVGASRPWGRPGSGLSLSARGHRARGVRTGFAPS